MEQALELAVVLMLIALAADLLRRLLRQKIHVHVHHHVPDIRHVPVHSHAREAPVQQVAGAAPEQGHAHHHVHDWPLRALAVGMMHGMAGTAALILLSLEAVQSFATGLSLFA